MARGAVKESLGLQAAIDAHDAKCGVLSFPFRPPHTWTIETIREVIGIMVRHLPASPSDQGCHCGRVVQHCRPDGAYISAEPYSNKYTAPKDGPFAASVYLEPDAAPAIAEWNAMFHNDFWSGGPLDSIDKILAQHRASRASHAHKQTQEDSDTDEYDDDDDLDFIERAARRALHGTGSRPTAQTPRFEGSRETTMEKFNRILAANPRYAVTLGFVFDVILHP